MDSLVQTRKKKTKKQTRNAREHVKDEASVATMAPQTYTTKRCAPNAGHYDRTNTYSRFLVCCTQHYFHVQPKHSFSQQNCQHRPKPVNSPAFRKKTKKTEHACPQTQSESSRSREDPDLVLPKNITRSDKQTVPACHPRHHNVRYSSRLPNYEVVPLVALLVRLARPPLFASCSPPLTKAVAAAAAEEAVDAPIGKSVVSC